MTAIASIAEAILAVRLTHPTRVGIDGFCASGKTTLADCLAAELHKAGRETIRVSADDFQNPPHVRWKLGSSSPEGFASFQIDFLALVQLLLQPLGPGGNLTFHTKCFDVRASRPNLSPPRTASSSAILLLDGLFLHAPALAGYLDRTVFVAADPEVCLARALARNQEGLATVAELELLYRKKYIPGYAIYQAANAPETRASFVYET